MFVLGIAAGIGLAVLPAKPTAQTISPATEQLAAQANGDPANPPTPAMTAAIAKARPLQQTANELGAARSAAQRPVNDARSSLGDAQQQLQSANEAVATAQRKVAKVEKAAQEEANFKAEATTIDYDQLIKSPSSYIGDKVVYTGQIFQIQEGYGHGFMMLSVTNEGYGFWTDEIWVDYSGHIQSAENDQVTVYGTVQGAKTYSTQIGGRRTLPRIKMQYIDE